MGLSYTDFWSMTLGEINRYITYNRKKQEEEADDTLKTAAFTAYYSGMFGHCRRMPDTLQKAFPSLFGRTADGQIKAENWQESERALRQIAERFNQNKRR